MQSQEYQRGPWYRGGVPRSYVPPSILASVHCSTCMIFFSVFFIFSGGAMFGSSRSMKETFTSDFFKKHSSKDPTETVGAVFLGIGCTMLAIAIGICIVAGLLARKQERKRHAELQNPSSTTTVHPPPPSAYPHQPPSNNVYPLAGICPTQPVVSGVPVDVHHQYPVQPADYPPPYSSVPPLAGNQYPTPSYTQPVAPKAPPQNARDIEQKP